MSVEFAPPRVGRLFSKDACHITNITKRLHLKFESERQDFLPPGGVEKSFDERLGKPTDIREARKLTVKLEAGSLEAKAGDIPPFLLVMTSLQSLLKGAYLRAKTLS